jgi:uncharacterized protein (TIGR01777 family)
MKKIVISGATGFVGTHLSDFLSQHGYAIDALTRYDLSLNDSDLSERLNGVYAVINLSGAPIIKRWTPVYKKELYTSRIKTTQKIANAIRLTTIKPELFISTSAVGIYKNKTPNTERAAQYDSGYLAKICKDWEASALTTLKITRTVIFRLGVVLSSKGGALKSLLPIFRMGLGGRVGTGDQGFPWIHLDDLLQAYLYILEHPETEGIFNLTAPDIITNKQFTETLSAVIKRPAIIPVSQFVLKMRYGEGAVALTEGAFVEPFRLIESGFEFRYPQLVDALKQIVKD